MCTPVKEVLLKTFFPEAVMVTLSGLSWPTHPGAHFAEEQQCPVGLSVLP